MKTALLLAMSLAASLDLQAQTSGIQLDLQVSYATHEPSSAEGGGGGVVLRPVDRLGIQAQGVTGVSWRVVGTVTDSRTAVVRVKWYRGEINLLEGSLNLPGQLGLEARFSVAPTTGLYRVELWAARVPQPETLLRTVSFEVFTDTSNARDRFEELREVAQQEEEAWRWKVQEIELYIAPRFLPPASPSCNLNRIRSVMRDVFELDNQRGQLDVPLMTVADGKWREYYTSRLERLNDEQNGKENPIPGAQEDLKVIERELQSIDKEIQTTAAGREVIEKGGGDLTKSDNRMRRLQDDKKKQIDRIALKKGQIADLEARKEQARVDLQNARDDLASVDKNAAYERDLLRIKLAEYERQCPN
jgi:hypothetical protein